MSKAILMSIKPRFAQLILGKTKTIEIRKRFPKDFKGWVYIYCTKNGDRPIYLPWEFDCHEEDGKFVADCDFEKGNGKVVARFWCDNVEEFGSKYAYAHKDNHFYDILKCACLTPRELTEYAPCTYEEYTKEKSKLYAITISKLEIFDKPKELNEFYGYTDKKIEWYTGLPKVRVLTSLTGAPQSWRYIEVE